MSQPMPLREHFRELRSRVFVCLIALLIGTAVAFYFYGEIYAILLRPAQDAAGVGNFKPVRTEITEFLSITVRVSLLGGFVLALPVILYNAIRFVAPGLTPRERKILFSFLPAALLAFVGGMAFGYFVMIPPALRFLIGFGSEVADPFIRISNIVNIMVRLLFWLGCHSRPHCSCMRWRYWELYRAGSLPGSAGFGWSPRSSSPPPSHPPSTH